MKGLVYIVVCIGFVSAFVETCGGNCPWGCPWCPCNNAANNVDVAAQCALKDWDTTCCACIVNHHSQGNANKMIFEGYLGEDQIWDAGLWMINSYNWPACGINLGNTCDLSLNLECAYKVWQWGATTANPRGTWRLWPGATSCNCQAVS